MNKLLVKEGFPVKIEVPVSFSIEAVVTFLVYSKIENDSNDNNKDYSRSLINKWG